MNKNLNVLGTMLFGMSVLFMGCQDNDMSDWNESHKQNNDEMALSQYGVFPQSEEFKLQSRTAGSTFETDWENFQTATLTSGTSVDLPWSENNSDANINVTLAKDIKKEDGWQMIYHSLAGGTSASGKHYMIFYNQRSGILKAFAYATNIQNNNTGFWIMNFAAQQRMLNAVTEVALPADLGNISHWRGSNPSNDDSASFRIGWNVIQIQLAYEPNTSQDQYLEIIPKPYNVSYLNLFGNLSSYSTGTIITEGGTETTNTLNNNMANIFGNSAAQYITDSLSNSRAILDLKEILNKGLNKLFSSFIASFSEPTITRYDVDIKTKTSGTSTGTMVTPGAIEIMSLRIPTNKTAFGTDLGAWNLVSTPIVYVHPIGTYLPTQNDYSLDECYYEYKASGNYDCNVVFNPELEKHLIKYWTTGELIRYPDQDTTIPQVPVSNFDYGSLAGSGVATVSLLPEDNYYSGMTGTGTFNFVETSDLIYGTYGQNGSIYDDHLRGVTNFKGLLAKYGTPQEGNTYPYIYLPDNVNLARGGFSYDGTKRFLKLSVYTITEFEGKRDTTVSTRTFAPKIEWDPELCNEFKDIPINTLSNYINRLK